MTTPDTPPEQPKTPPPEALGAACDWQLYTPAEAARTLAVKESWLRRKAGSRCIPCTFLGKHLRFSADDLRAIATGRTRQPPARRGRPRRT